MMQILITVYSTGSNGDCCELDSRICSTYSRNTLPVHEGGACQSCMVLATPSGHSGAMVRQDPICT